MSESNSETQEEKNWDKDVTLLNIILYRNGFHHFIANNGLCPSYHEMI